MENFKFDLKEIFNKKQYKRLNPYQKEIFVTNFFHSVMWKRIKVEERIVLLRELEHVLSTLYKRSKYHIVVLPSSYKVEEDYFDLQTIFEDKSIRIRKNFLEEGILQAGKKLSYLNLYLLDGMYHENYHITSYTHIRSKLLTFLEREFIEYWLWINTLQEEECITAKESEYIENDLLAYRMIPDEYYAYDFAYQKVCSIFMRTLALYGEDENFTEYVLVMEGEKINFSYQYNQEHHTNYTFDELYEKVYLKQIIASLSQSKEEEKRYYEKLGEYKRFIKK